jgi:cytochrome d ubiquinol oxidase subunit I
MAVAGGIIGPAFALEGYAFFIEAIFLGLYLYGWDRLSPRAHWLTGFPVALSGMASGILVVAANAWMQAPNGFVISGGELIRADPLAPFRSPAWLHMSIHSTLSCYIATGFAVAGVYAMGTLRGRRDEYHRSALGIAMAMAASTALLQPLSGDLSARRIARYQPAKLAAMEVHFETAPGVPLVVGGWPDAETQTVRFGIRIPRLFSLLATHDPNGVVRGLNEFPRSQWPNLPITHLAFQAMVGCGLALIAVSAAFWWWRWRRRVPEGRRLLVALVVAGPLGFIALETGWLVTEVGRQPWVIYGVMLTADGVTPVPEVPLTFFGFTLLYIGLAAALTYLLLKLASAHAD